MGKRGPARTPTNILDLRGSSLAKGRKKREPQPKQAEEGDLKAPGLLSERGKREWSRIAPELARIGLLTVADFPMLMVYCEAFSDWQTLREARKRGKRGAIITDSKGNRRRNPELLAEKNLIEVLCKCAAKFGLSPADRSGIGSGAATGALLPEAPVTKEKKGKQKFFR